MTKPGTAAGAAEVEARQRELVVKLGKEYSAPQRNAQEYLRCSIRLDSAVDVNEALMRLARMSRERTQSIFIDGYRPITYALRESMASGSDRVVNYLVRELLERDGGSGRQVGRVMRWGCGEDDMAAIRRDFGDVLMFAVQGSTRRSTVGLIVDVLRELGRDVTTPLDIGDLSHYAPGVLELATRGLLRGDMAHYCEQMRSVPGTAMAYALARGGAWAAAMKGDVAGVEAGMGAAKMKLLEDSATYGVLMPISASVRSLHLVAVAAMSGSAATVEYVLRRSVGEDETTAGMLSVALEVAAASGSGGGVVEALLQGGARFGDASQATWAIEDAFWKDLSGTTGAALLEVAAASGYEEAANPAKYLPCGVRYCGSSVGHVVNVLLEAGLDVEAYTEDSGIFGPSLLHAVWSDSVGGVYELLHAGASVLIDRVGYDTRRNEVGLQVHLEALAGPVGASDRVSALHEARSGIVARLLVEAGAPVEEAYGGVTPLHFACAIGEVEVVRVLVESGANVDAMLRASHGEFVELNRPLLIALRGIVHMWDTSCLYVDMIRALVGQGADVNVRGGSDGRGVTALLAVVSPCRVDQMVQFTPSHVDSRIQDEVVELLLAAGADIHTKDAGGNGVLHRAMAAGSADPGPLVESLLRHGARASEVNERGERADEVWWVHRGVRVSQPNGRGGRDELGPSGQFFVRNMSDYIPTSVPAGVDVAKPPDGAIARVCERLRASAEMIS